VSGRATAAAAAEEVRERLDAGDENNALRAVWQLSASLFAAGPAELTALTVAEPEPTCDPRFDALLAGIVDYVLSSAHLPIPAWVAEPARVLETPWDVEPVPTLRGAARAATPEAIRRHGVHLDPAELVNR
jgi:hypothetical protein